MILSILICALESRFLLLTNLLDELKTQQTEDVEIIVEMDRGQLTTGEKRNVLLAKAKGAYICFIDDDDFVANDYLSEVLNALKLSPDAVGFEGYITTNGANKIRWKISKDLPYETSFQNSRPIYLRYNNHLSPVKRELALQTGFKNLTIGEDYDYATRLRPLIKTEVYIPKELYYYHYKTK